MEYGDDYERCAIDSLERVLMVRINSKSAGAYVRDGAYARIYDYDLEKVKAYRPEVIQVIVEEDSEFEPAEQTIESIVSEQTKAWCHLHRLVAKDWKQEFHDFQDEIGELHQKVNRQRGYLKAKFETLASDIEKGKERGIAFLACESCGFESAKQELIAGNLYSSYCLVCELRSNKKLREECPNCNRPIYIYDLGQAYCEDCDEDFELADFVEKYAPITYLGE